MTYPDRLLTIEEAAEFLGLTPRSLGTMVTRREVPHTRIGRGVRFSATHLREIVEAGEQPVISRRRNARRGSARTRL